MYLIVKLEKVFSLQLDHLNFPFVDNKNFNCLLKSEINYL